MKQTFHSHFLTPSLKSVSSERPTGGAPPATNEANTFFLTPLQRQVLQVGKPAQRTGSPYTLTPLIGSARSQSVYT
ncbi:MAG: hypothetical protein KME49_04645 [Brasilonema octagenarum HA4186-MV1]|uniref:Uncharacterized protein n=2 Tax=Brasilonema TaxID=383614 RepID=A0A856MMM5_9CYAN|nr:hypothetical protein [Brasilonema sennae]MBW4624804.1 hypothetical protein [Brasilonema octagenarum HA4186-MV1]QDL10176.1 hypothetical protein DP114_21800 [Brasilonema sennae CENA114]